MSPRKVKKQQYTPAFHREVNIKPCPFCGSASVEVLDAATERGKLHFVHCYHCGALGPDDADPDQAIRLWNKRHHPAYSLGAAPRETA